MSVFRSFSIFLKRKNSLLMNEIAKISLLPSENTTTADLSCTQTAAGGRGPAAHVPVMPTSRLLGARHMSCCALGQR